MLKGVRSEGVGVAVLKAPVSARPMRYQSGRVEVCLGKVLAMMAGVVEC